MATLKKSLLHFSRYQQLIFFFTVNRTWCEHVVKNNTWYECTSHPVWAAFGRHTWRESVHYLTHNSISNSAVSGSTPFSWEFVLCAIWSGRASALSCPLLVPGGGQGFQGRVELVSCSRDALTTGRLQRQSSLLRQTSDELIYSLGRGGDRLSAAAEVGVSVSSWKGDHSQIEDLQQQSGSFWPLWQLTNHHALCPNYSFFFFL